MTLLLCEKYGLKRNGPQAAETANGPNHNASVQGDARMTVDSQYKDSESKGKPENIPQWKSVGDLARALVYEMAERRASK